MDVPQILARANDHFSVKRVYGEPIEGDGTLVIPAAAVRGAAGGGGDGDPEAEGGGGGMGFTARPVGAYSIRDGVVVWHPALDLNRAILGGQVVAVALILTVRSIVRRHAR